MRDYTIYYRRSVSVADLTHLSWDTVVSAYNGSERVQSVFNEIRAPRKHWLLHREYGFAESDHPTNDHVVSSNADNEADFLIDFLHIAEPDLRVGSLCIDITGFMRPHLMLLLRLLRDMGVTEFDVIYTDPSQYTDSEKT